ncbi:MAG: hypothetical protein D6703_05510 [Zetaproteobacteria bacterium]|nr:MAG: hypothetical protein D6703_05510 [Zetaproteobacteria bacterium]
MKTWSWMLLLCGVFVLAMPAEGQVLSLQEAVHLALERAPGFQADRAKRDTAKEDVLLARAWLLPYVKASASYRHLEQKYRYAHPLAIPLRTRLNYNQSTMAIQLIQPLFRLDRWAAWKQGQVADEVAETALQLARQALVLEVADRYSEALVARIELAAVQRKRDAMQRSSEMVDARLRSGLATRPEQLEAQSRAHLAQAEWLAAKQRWDIARARLESLIGHEHPPFPEELPEISLPKGDQDWAELARNHALPVKLARLKYAIAEREVQRSLGQALPSVDLVAGISRDRTTDGLFGAGATRKDEMIGIEVEVPIYAGGGTWAQLRKSKKQRIESSFRLQDAEREAMLSAREAFMEMNSAQAREHALHEAMVAAESAKRAALISFEAGLSTIVSVLDAESRLADARRAWAQAKRAELMARLRLDASTGRLDVGALPLRP